MGQWAGWTTALLLPSLAVATGCSDTVVTTVDVEEVRVNPSEAPLSIGSTIQLQAELLDNEGKAVTGVPVSWSSEDESVVEVNGDGEVTGRSAGEAIVRATADGVTGLAIIHVQHAAPAAPSDLVARPVDLDDGMNVHLEWRDNSDDETSFRIERRNVLSQGEFELLTTVDPDATSYLDETVSADATYSYRVLACAEGGCSGSDAVSITTPPLAPSGLEATAQSSTTIRITWSDNSTTETGFELERKTGAGDYTRINRLERNSTSFEDTNVDPDRTYSYRIRACNEDSCSRYSAPAAATTVDPAPSDLEVSELTEDYVELSWKNNSGGETEFRILRRRHHPPENDFGQIGSISTDAENPTFRDDDVKEERTYDYRVQTCDASGQCVSSNTITVTIPED